MENEVLPIVSFLSGFFHLLYAMSVEHLTFRRDNIWKQLQVISIREHLFQNNTTNIFSAITTSLTLTDTPWLIVPNERSRIPRFELRS